MTPQRRLEKSKEALKEAVERWKPARGTASSGGKDPTAILALTRGIPIVSQHRLLHTQSQGALPRMAHDFE